jgi:L-lactate dehydrogenase complex protein LldG
MTGEAELSAAVTRLLSRVRDAVRAQPVSEPEVPSHAVVRRIAADAGGLASMFAERAAAVGMKVVRTDEAGLDVTLAATIAGRGPTVVAVADASLAARASAAVQAAEGASLRPSDDGDALFEAAVGVTDVDAAIAESGSLVVSTNGRIRNAWITPPVHVAIVRESQLLPDLVDLFPLRPDCLDAASTTIITGPSKTADIEGVLVTGVHGPGEVTIVLVAGA